MTACMVRLGLLGTVHDIVVSLCEQDRADAVAAVTAGLLTQREVVIVTRITNALVASGHSDHATTISGPLLLFLPSYHDKSSHSCLMRCWQDFCGYKQYWGK